MRSICRLPWIADLNVLHRVRMPTPRFATNRYAVLMATPASSPTAADDRHILSVSDLTLAIKGTLERDFTSVWVGGEISDVSRPHSGHIYFTLKDDGAQIKGIIWRSAAQRIKFD